MKKIFSIFAAVLFAGSMMADVTVTKSIHDLFPNDANGTQQATLYSDAVLSISVNDDGNNGKVYGTGTEWRLYQSNNAVVTVAATDATIKTVAFEFTVKNTGVLNFGGNAMTSNTAVNVNAASAQFVVANSGTATNGQVIIKSFTVVYEASGDVPPVEDDCNWEEIAFLGNGSGNAAYTDRFKVCVGDPAPSSIVNIQSSFGTEPGIYVTFPSAEFGDISLDEDQYAIQGAGMLLYVSAFLYDAETEVTVVCQNVEYSLTVKNVNPETAPVEPTTCFDIYQMAKNDVVDLLNDVTVTYANGKNVWVVDGSASMLLYFSANTNYAPGDVLSGVAGVVDIYNGVYELKPSAEQAAAIVATPGEAPAAIQTVVVETADMNKYIVMPGIQFEEDAAFTEGAQSNITMNGVTVRNQFKNGYAFEAGKKYNVYGVVTIYQNNPQVYFITAEELDTTGFDNAASELNAVKVIENGQLFIIKNGVRYDAQGAVVR